MGLQWKYNSKLFSSIVFPRSSWLYGERAWSGLPGSPYHRGETPYYR